jgi:fluoroquinolone resistance protein
MRKSLTEDREFKGVDFTEEPLAKGDYEGCVFNNCIFTNTDLSHVNFSECEFVNCDLSMAKLLNAAFRDVKFRGCKLLGLRFDDCNEFLFTVSFEDCQLNLSSFYRRTLKKTNFTNCNLQETDFAEADLAYAVFNNCELSGAVFDNTVLENADLRTAFNFSIDPEKNKIKKAKFSRQGLEGLLHKYSLVIE